MGAPTAGARLLTVALWSGRFAAAPAQELWDLTVDLATDGQLWREDLAVNRAHAHMLAACGILAPAVAAALECALDQVEEELAGGRFVFVDSDEDVHMAVERRLTELAGDAGRAVHAGRSRNDQVATDFRLWCRGAAARLTAGLDRLSGALLDQVDRAGAALAPGYTHLQPAQPVTLGLVLLAHVAAFDRDAGRLAAAAERADECPLGAGALATSTLPLDPAATARELGFARPFGNSIDAVAARDFALELLAAAAIAAVHLSRLGEEVVLWATDEFGFVALDDAWSTGSSMMPQKKNPDVAELARATAGRVQGALVALLTVNKGLPLSYNRDLQEDKAITLTAVRRLELALAGMAGLIAGCSFRLDRLEQRAAAAGAAATDLAERLVAEGVPFRLAHERIGALVGRLAAAHRGLAEVTAEELAAVHPCLAGCSGSWLSARACVDRRRLPGGPHPEAVAAAAAEARARIARRTTKETR
jgi:argininosuccinate lyase